MSRSSDGDTAGNSARSEEATVHEGDVHELDPSRWKAPDNTLRGAAFLGDAQLAENVEQVAERLVCTGAVETENSRRPQSQPARAPAIGSNSSEDVDAKNAGAEIPFGNFGARRSPPPQISQRFPWLAT